MFFAVVGAYAFFLVFNVKLANPFASWRDLTSALTAENLAQIEVASIYYLALPRFIMAVVAGVALAISGTLIQQSLQNVYASPSTLGINAGAMLAFLLVSLFASDMVLRWVVLITFIGGLTTGLLVYGLAKVISNSPLNIILVGMAVSLALGALSAALLMLFEGKLDGFYIWGAGNLAQADFSQVNKIWPLVLLLSALALLLSKRLDLFVVGDSLATGLGVKVTQTRVLSLLVAIALAAIVVSALGMISFIGLVAPHIAQRLGAKTTLVRTIAAAVIGSFLLVSADSVALMLASQNIVVPAGAMTTLIGAPFMIYLLRQQQAQLGQHHELSEVGIRPVICLPPRWVLFGLSVILLSSVTYVISDMVNISLQLPRLGVAIISGMSLAIAGLLLQTLLHNPLASPDVTGVTSTGILGVVVVASFIPLTKSSIVIVSLSGSLMVCVIAYCWLRQARPSPERWVLLGMCLSAFSGTAISVVMSLGATQSSEALFWLSGAIYGADETSLLWLMPLTIILLLLAVFAGRPLNLLYLGATHAQQVGLNTALAISILVLVVIILCAFSVAVVGGIAFIGLIAPHMLRVLGNIDHRHLLVVTALLGASIVVIADKIASQLLFPFELPTGLVVSITGGFYFVILLLSGKYTTVKR